MSVFAPPLTLCHSWDRALGVGYVWADGGLRTGRIKDMFRKNRGGRPNPARQALLAGAAIIALGVGYAAGVFFREGGERPEKAGKVPIKAPVKPAEIKEPKPWYSKQGTAPALISTPDAPLFSGPVDNAQEKPSLPYEEPLPKEIYQADEPPQPAAQPIAKTTPEPEQAPPPAWIRNSIPAPLAGGRPLIALVIDDMGMDRKRTARAAALKGPLTLSYLTYAGDLLKQTEKAKANGHELMLHMSMEPDSDAVDPGPNVLLLSLGPKELKRRLNWGLDRFNTFVGVNNHMGSKFTENERGMTVVLEEIKKRGLLFLDSRTSGRTVGAKLARRLGVPFAERNIFIDNDLNEEAIMARLAETERLAKRNGFAIAIGHPREATLNALTKWLGDIEARGFVLTPVSALIKRRLGDAEKGGRTSEKNLLVDK